MFDHTRVLVTGASGFLGGALALRLASEGVRVRALVRRPEKAAFLPASVEIVQGDLLDPAALRSAAEGCAYVFHCAAALGGDLAMQRRINVDGTRLLAETAAQAGIKRLIHVSTLSVYGVMYSGIIDESAAFAPGSDPYGITKAEAERVLRSTAAALGLDYAILRPGMIYGARASLWTGTLFRLARLNPTPWFGDGSGLAHCIHVDDVLDLLLRAAEHPQASGEAFNCVMSPAPTWRAFLGEYARLAHAQHDEWLELPRWPLYAIAGITMLLSPPVSRARMMPDFVRFMLGRAQFSMSKARERLGWEPQVDLETGVARCADWLRAEGLLA